MGISSIEWTDVTWNPATGCTKVSPGCAHCYAEAVAPRSFKGRPFTEVKFHPERLEQPLHWRKPRRVFVNSMSDLFHEALTDVQIANILDVIEACPQHTFQALTKRSQRMRDYFTRYLDAEGLRVPSNLWLGVSVENQHLADERIPHLLMTPTTGVRFLSVEPLLAPVDLRRWMPSDPEYRPSGIDWCIVGGESGRKARQCDLRWVRSIVNQCRDATVPAFVKQVGRRPVSRDMEHNEIVNMKGGDPSEWPADLRVREFPRTQKRPAETGRPTPTA